MCPAEPATYPPDYVSRYSAPASAPVTAGRTVREPKIGDRVLDPTNPHYGPVTVEQVFWSGRLVSGVTDFGRPVSIDRPLAHDWTLADPTPVIP